MKRIIMTLAALTVAGGLVTEVRAETRDFTVDVSDYAAERELEIDVELSLPAGRKTWPVVFVLHGCDGITRFSAPTLKKRAAFYRDRGFATVILDSWRPRGIDNVCTPGAADTALYLDPVNRISDIEAVTSHIATLDGFDGRIVVDGLSHGGWTALSILSSPGDEPLQAEVAGIVVWYPPCGIVDATHRTPTLIFSGGKDAHPAINPQACVEEGERYGWVETVLFKNATHAFDYSYTGPSGGPSGFIRHDAQATHEAYLRLEDWLKEQGLP
ncbi:dienelactone hydrolase [Parvibaculum lavamentivorans DS-1]|uniref:Dienelactone hydrolase n=1 Tax=Parvibaculum lavamentivorans (strain DS-1 / DSM 13023 / NCIMB 13966) TaxID=402881 RepID=A7HR28_PARL1|nr:dienelactone hydrolase family protein [Parvibaculum lavamentivorans]ABS62361.1 dienelactone hydrolase [Parvibaculum lavamentivorans DS-1]